MTSWGRLYQDHVGAVATLFRDLDAERLDDTVPATPDWTVRDVLAHLAGGPADALAGRTDDAPGTAWTRRHVLERKGRDVASLLDELQENAGAVAESVATSSPGTVWDIAVHHADLREALDLTALAELLWAPVLADVAPRWLDPAVATRLESVRPYEVFRILFSRRSRSQVQAACPSLSEQQVDSLGIFGPRDDDQVIPA